MKIIHKYVLREHAGPLAFALSALTSIMLLNYVAKQLGNLVGKGLPWQVILEFFLLSVPFTIAMTLPMAVLVAVLYAFSRLAAENEITALKANGVSMSTLMIPVLCGGALLALTMIIFNDQVLPRTNHRLRTLQGDIARKKPTFAIKEQIINEVAPGRFFLRTNHLNRETNGLREVTIYDLSDPLRRRTIYADSGIMAFVDEGADLQLTLYDGFMQEVPKDAPTRLQRLYYKVDLIKVEGVANAFQRDSSDNYKSDREMSVCELQNEVARYERDYFRSYNAYLRAASLAKQDPQALVEISVGDPTMMPGNRAPRSRVQSLGRSYCDGLRYLEERGLGNLTLLAMRGAGSLLFPQAAFAASAPATPDAHASPVVAATTHRQSAQDTVRRSGDTLRTRGDSSTARDSAVVAPIQRPPTPLPAGVTVVNGDTIYPGFTPTPEATGAVPPAEQSGVPPGVPPAPSSGMSPTIPAAVAMETSRSQMLTARAQLNQYAVEIQKKFAISMACIVFVLLGAPIALRFPRGGVGLVIGVSLGVFGLYYVGLIAGEALADRAILTPFWAMWAANILFTAIAVVLLARMGRESATSRGGDLSEMMDSMKAFFSRSRRRERIA
ncbi:MAG: LptF/LptG family permease [Gemmatimonadaceae bacterium]